MSKHTPGPWYVVPLDTDLRVVAHQGYRVARLYPEDVENARLIAAAPELLEALQACATILPRYHMSGKTTGEDEEHSAVLERVLEAIAKAGGKP